ncbi:MAG: succinate dehydrogenase iron-sulfur subunit [Armatimonadetes bacterium]|nr:succinate dehydrogenase iron-sulfur subunit [Armatimonadota bacterium]
MKATFKIFRFNPESNEKPSFKNYSLEISKGITVLDALGEIKAHQDGGITYRRSCRSAICGSCAININGINALACRTQIETLNSPIIKLEPLPGFKIIKDLVADFEEFFEKLKKIKPFLITYSIPPEKERLQGHKERKIIDQALNCILCGACTSSCPSFWMNKNYLGPAAINKSFRFIFDSRDEGKEEHLDAVNQEQSGLWRCHTILNCVDACPKNIDITKNINSLRLKLSNP